MSKTNKSLYTIGRDLLFNQRAPLYMLIIVLCSKMNYKGENV